MGHPVVHSGSVISSGPVYIILHIWHTDPSPPALLHTDQSRLTNFFHERATAPSYEEHKIWKNRVDSLRERTLVSTHAIKKGVITWRRPAGRTHHGLFDRCYARARSFDVHEKKAVNQKKNPGVKGVVFRVLMYDCRIFVPGRVTVCPRSSDPFYIIRITT